MKRIALLGCGSMGTQIALAIDSENFPATLTHVYDASKDSSLSLVQKLQNKPEIVENSHLLSSQPIDIVVEAASQDAVKDVALSVLQNKKDLMIMSVGALLDESIYDILSDACKDFKKTIYLPSGAIAGLDGIKSVKDELESLSITTTKHPRSLKGAKFFETSEVNLDEISSSTVVYEGTAKEAVSLFPANINVAALLSLTGIGSEKTSVKIVADPSTDKNTHHIEAAGKFGKMTFTIENVPDTNNPKTSRLAILSAIETLKKYCSDDIQIGT
ncbi:putative L-aspartate dehydrogenase protein [Marine Group I thaumarchaeote SCGC RSA3]|uniref:L-aspartate dehydrogenase n=3 Tax=Marine Group I TaxID=905826 RepID=A0A081RP10_9ARCH|nr:putative L-aspartate dehydrogenase protein [Marine Group I thaumarchaeote SCGC AAA799-N04]KFM15734.1 putative L-aspartate dehydrogenase protein [Marine Group I thaumarchaeote SCGC AAA799-D11]KFM17146.1 putative L-aspartate dehydrogenase protein [Marine Group I thaumarchaeote SCGC RSA3]